MPKHPRDEYVEEQRISKQPRLDRPDRFSLLSDELVLRTLAFLSVPDLVICQRYVYASFECDHVTNREDSPGG